jgi:NAD(P)-dependent dehydrogenase (short-subunit alcohol dehydrogenase family)
MRRCRTSSQQRLHRRRTSLAGLIGVPGRTAYSASKFAMAASSKPAHRAQAAGVSVTTAYRRGGYAHPLPRLQRQRRAAGVSGLKEDGAMTAVECARPILRRPEAPSAR